MGQILYGQFGPSCLNIRAIRLSIHTVMLRYTYRHKTHLRDKCYTDNLIPGVSVYDTSLYIETHIIRSKMLLKIVKWLFSQLLSLLEQCCKWFCTESAVLSVYRDPHLVHIPLSDVIDSPYIETQVYMVILKSAIIF